MQTFLPFPDFVRSARVLDYQRLGKQRSETMIIWKTLTGVYAREGKKGWPHHPATKMWAGHENSLLLYGLEMCSEWNRRGYQDDGTLAWFVERMDWAGNIEPPPWLGRKDFHQAHRSQLVQKLPAYYRTYWPTVPDNLDYVWPTKEAR
jgi:hypothetical protein